MSGNQVNGAEALVKMLSLYGVKHIFGLCGDTSLPFYDALYRLDHGMTHVLTRDERSAGYMADAYARVSGRVGVCEGPSGGGATYLLPGLAEANESSSPVLGFTSDVPVASRGRYPLTELDQEALYRPVTKWNTTVDLASQLPAAVRTAFRAMTTGTPGAAHICLPFDVLKQPLAASDVWAQAEHGAYPALRVAPAPDDISRAAALLRSAERPVIICGGGVLVSGASNELSALAQRIAAPVCTTVSGKGTLVDADPLSAGVVGANGGVPATREIVAAADLVLFIGCRAGSTTTENWRFPAPGITIVHIDTDPMVIGANYRTDAAIVADAKLALTALLAALEEPGRRTMADAAAAVAAAKAKKRSLFEALAGRDDRPILPERVIHELNLAMPRDGIVVADPGTPCPYAAAYFELRDAGRYFLTNRAHGALGYAMSAGVGAWFARPESKVVAIMGDGSFGFTVGELETIVRLKVPLTMIVLSNAVYGWIKASQKSGYDARYYSVDFDRTDHARIASAYGVRSWRVEDPIELSTVVREAMVHDGPTLIDIIVQPLQEAAAPVSQWMG